MLHLDPAWRPRSRRAGRRRVRFGADLLALEGRTLLSADAGVPIPASNPVVELSTIFWNGEPAPLNAATGKANVPSPAAAGAMKTITLTNYAPDFIYPFLRSSNDGRDPNDTNDGFYDPQDLQHREFRQYLGYSDAAGARYLGLPPGATIQFQVPLVLWDGNNISLVTDGTYLTASGDAPGAKVFNYNAGARISVAGAAPVSGTSWVQAGANYPAGTTPLVMFYFDDAEPTTVPNDAPAQLAELTFRDPYLKHFIDDPFQTFPEINYDLSYVNTLVAPAAMEASGVPVTSGAVASGNLAYYPPAEDFGWHGSSQGTATFDPLVANFVANAGAASVGQYFGGEGWPQYYNPDPSIGVIPSGANVFDNSPIVATGAPGPVNVSNYDNNRWLLSSAGGGAIAAAAGGAVLKNPQAAQLPLLFADQNQRNAFVQSINSMTASGQPINLTLSTADPRFQGVLGKFVRYNPSSSVSSYVVTSGGSGYSQKTYARIVGGGGSGAQGDVQVVNGVVTGIGLNPATDGSGYTSPPQVVIIDPTGRGQGAAAMATITGGTAVVQLAPGKSLPTGVGLSYVFRRTGSDYAATAITNLWYSWAQYYVNQFNNYAPQAVRGSVASLPLPGGGSPVPTNQIALAAPPKVALAPGMTVQGPGIPAGATVLKVAGTTVYLSQIAAAGTAPNQQYTFGRPKPLPIDPVSARYTQAYPLTFAPAQARAARLFAGSVYEAMAVQAANLPPAAYLPTTMNVVDHVIKFYAKIPTYEQPWGPTLVGEVRDVVKSILRGVPDYYQAPDQSQWYPNPATPTGGRNFNVFNLDPYVWFVHRVQGLTGYGFSVDDDVANPSATGPRDDDANHAPGDLQIGFAGIAGTGPTAHARPLGNPREWFPTTKWGRLNTTATIGVQPDGPYQGSSVVTLVGPDAIRTLNQIITPGPGQVGAAIINPSYIVPGTTLIYFPDGVLTPKIILSQPAISTSTPIPVTISAEPAPTPLAVVGNPNFSAPPQTVAPFYSIAPKGPNVAWTFTGTAGIAGQGSTYTANNPAPLGTQVGFVQGTGALGQAVTLQAGRAYAVSFLVAQRRQDDGSVDAQGLRVTVGDQVVGDFRPAPTVDGSYTLFTSTAFTVPKNGPYTLTIAGSDPTGGGDTALIDQVSVAGGIIVQGGRPASSAAPAAGRAGSARRRA